MSGLDPYYPDDRFDLIEARRLEGWSVALWQRAPSRDGRASGYGNLAILQGPGPSPPPLQEAAAIDPLTGTDIDGDGHPEAVLRSWSGGAHCCESIHVYRLSPQAATPILQTPASDCPGRFEDLDADGRPELITCDDRFAYAFCAFASSPMPRVVLSFDPALDAYAPASQRFAPLLEPLPSPEPVVTPSEDALPVQRCAALEPALDALYAGDGARAWRRIDEIATSTGAPELRGEIERILAESPYYRAPGAPATPILITP